MPCDAIATVTASLALEQSEGIDSQLLQEMLENYLKQKGYASISVSTTGNLIKIQVNSKRIIISEKQVMVAGGSKAENQRLTSELQQFIKEASGIMVQQKIQQLVASQYTVEQAVYAPNKALVLSVNL